MKESKTINSECKDCLAKDKCDAEFGDGRCIAIGISECYNKAQKDFAKELAHLGEELSKKYSKELEEINKRCHSTPFGTVMDLKK
jgi:hypothetical protein